MSKSEAIVSQSSVKMPPHNREKKTTLPFFSPGHIQPKLTIGPVDDPCEREADATADKVMRMSDPDTVATQPSPLTLQAKCAACVQDELHRKEEDEDEEQPVQWKRISDFPVQRKCVACELEDKLQLKRVTAHHLQGKCKHCETEERKSQVLQSKLVPENLLQRCSCNEESKIERKVNGANAPMVTPLVVRTLSSGGQPLEGMVRSFMEKRFGYDFKDVKIHNDAVAHQSSADLKALAYTHGNHIVFGKGQYEPHTESGKKLLAHELTHTLQQGRFARKIQKQSEPYASERPVPRNFSYDTLKAFFRKVKKEGTVLQKPLDFIFVIVGNIVYIYDSTGYVGKVQFERKSSLNLEGYFINYDSDLSRRQTDDSWHFVRQTNSDLSAVRLIPMVPAYENRDIQDERHRLSLEFYSLLHDIQGTLNMVSLSVIREKNIYNIGVVVTINSSSHESSGKGEARETKQEPNYIFRLPAWLAQTEKSIKEKIAKIKQSNPNDQSLPSGFKFYTTDIIQVQEGESSWRLRVDNAKEKKYIKINKKDWDKADDKEAFAEAVLNRMIGIVTEQNRSKATRQFDEKEAAENKVKASKGSQFAGLFKLRDNIWKTLETLKKAQPSATDIPDKLTLEFYGDTGAEKAYFKIWLQKMATPGKIEFSGSVVGKQVSINDDITQWVVLLRQQTAIQQLILSGTDPKEFVNWENETYNPQGSLQLAPFPAEIIPKNLNPDFTTVKGASNEFLMSLNWYAIYGVRDDLIIASILSHVKTHYVFLVLNLPPDIVKMRSEKVKPDELKKASEEYIKKSKPAKPYKDFYEQRDSSIDISMDSEGSFLLASYASVKHPDDNAPRAISIAAHPYFVTEINALADKTVLDMDVAATLRKKLQTESDPEKRKLLEDQIKEIEDRQSKGYGAQAREDIGDIDKLIAQANDLLKFIQQEKKIGTYTGDFEYDPFPIRVAKKKPDLIPIYQLVKDKTITYSFGEDESLTLSFIQSLENEKKDLGKLAKRVSTPKGDFKASATKYKALAVSVNEDNGRIVPVMLLIGEHKNSNPSKNKYKHIIFDVTTDAYDESKMLYPGDEKSSEAESVNSAFVKFGEDNNYGEGKVAYRVPALGYTGTVRSYTTVWEWIEKALMVLTFVLLAFGVILSGGGLGPLAAAVLGGLNTILGVSAGVLGAVMAIRSMASRSEKGTLRMNAQTSMDILNIIGGFTGTLTTAAKFAKVRISGTLLAVYEATEFSGNVYLVHAKLQEDLAAIKGLNLTDPNDIKLLMEQAYAEAEQQGAMLLTTVVAGKLFHEGEGKILKEEDLPPPAKEKIENTGYKTYKEKGWINNAGEVTENAPPFLREMTKAAKQEPTPTKQEPTEPKQEPVTKPKVEPTATAPKPAETSAKGGEHTAVDPHDALAHKEIKIRNEDHDVVVTKDAIGLCSPDCPVIDFEYKQELNDNPLLAERNRQINELRKAGKSKKAAELTAELIPELESARAKKIKMIAPETTSGSEPQAGLGKTTDTSGGSPGKPTEPPGTAPVKQPKLELGTPAARKEAEEWELIAHQSEKDAQSNRRLAEDEQAKAERFRREGREAEAKQAEQTAAAARRQASKDANDVVEARNEAGKLRGGKEGLTGEQILERNELNETATQLKEEIKGKKPGLQERRDELQKAKDKLVERRDALRKLDIDRRTPGTSENQLSSREYQKKVQEAEAGIQSAEKNVDAKEKALERDRQPITEAEKNLKKANDRLFELDKLDKGLSEANPNAKGDFAEARATEYLADKGFEKIGGHSDKRQGIDGIYRKAGPPPENIVAEVKYDDDAKKYLNDPERAMREKLEDTADGPQLSDKWTERRIEDAVKNDQALADQIRSEGYTKVLLIYDAKTRQFLSPIIVP